LGVVFISLVVGGFLGFRWLSARERDRLLTVAWSNLGTIADLRAIQVSDWYRGREAEVTSLAEAPLVAAEVASLSLHPADTTRQSHATDLLEIMLGRQQFRSALLLTPAGTPLAGAGEPMPSVDADYLARVAAVAKTGQPEVIDLHRNSAGAILMDFLAPVRARRDTPEPPGPVIGVLLATADPARHLYPLVRSWPGDSRTGETLLVRRDGKDVVFLHELNHQAGAALGRRRPVATPSLPGAVAARNGAGNWQGADYRGRPVVFVTRPVAGTPWFLIAKIDESEALAGARSLELSLMLAGVAFTLAVALLVLLTRRLQGRQAQAELEASEERFRRAVLGSPFPVILHAEDGQVLQVSDSWVAITGYAREEMPTIEAWTQLAYGERHGNVRSYIDRLYALDKAVAEGDYTIRTRSGENRTWEFSSAPLGRMRDGRRVVISMALDVTERRAAEAQARLLSHVLRQAPISLVITDTEGRIEYVNPKFEEVTGYTFAEVLGQNPRLLKSGRTSPRLYTEMWRRLVAGHEWRGEMENRRKNGEFYWEDAIIAPVRDQAGRTTHYVATKLEITSRIRDSATIRDQAALLDAANDAIYVRSPEGIIRSWNSGAERLYGWSAPEAIGQSVDQLPLITSDELAEHNRVLLATGTWSGECACRTRDGLARVVLTRLTVKRGPEGQPDSVLAIGSDVTEQKQLAARFQQAQRLENLGALASGLAHDLNNVLSPVLMGTSVLKRSATTAAQRDLLDTMEASAKRGAGIVRQVLTFARGVEGERAAVSLRHLLGEMSNIMRETFPKNIQVSAPVTRGLWPVIGDATQLHQVLMNLCINARDAMPGGGSLELRADNLELDEALAAAHPGARVGPHVRLRVTDTGTGIAPEHLDKIFDPFFTTKARGRGTGLGLSSLIGIVRSHGGFVTVRSTLDQGTEFAVHLPAAPDQVVAPGTNPSVATPVAAGTLVLVVDDEAAIRFIAQQVLQSAGYRVLTASDGRDALAQFRAQGPEISLVVSDMMMPVMDGPALITEIRRLQPDAHVIGMTGAGEEAMLQAIEALHLSLTLTKPFTVDQLLHAVHAALHPPAPVTPG